MKTPASRILLALAAIPLALGVAASGTVAAPDNTIWVAVAGPAAVSFPSRSYELQIGSKAWPLPAGGGGGVASASFKGSVTVRLVDAADCTKVASFTAALGTRWVVRFGSASATPGVENWTGRGLDTGPALGEDPTPSCALPDTSTTTFGVSELPDDLPLVPIGIGLLVLAASLWQLQWPRQSSPNTA